MRVFSWVLLTVALGLTAKYVETGLAGESEQAWANGWLVGPILLCSVLPTLFAIAPMFEGRGPSARQFADAPLAIGTVVSLARTGLTINDQPQLDITLDVSTVDGRVFRGVARQLVDLTDIAALVPGTVLPVRYLPGEGRVVLATDAAPALIQATFSRIQLARGEITPHQLHIAEQGVEARAVVLAMRPTGEIRNNRAVAVVALRVSRPEGGTFDLELEKALPPEAVPRVQPGAVVRVRYLPGDRSDVVIQAALMDR